MTQEQKLLDKAFFETNPRSALLRNICLGALDASRKAISTEGEDELAFTELLEANRQLAELGIEPGMHNIPSDDPDSAAKQSRMVSDPVIASEWLSGQMRNLIINTTGFIETTCSLTASLEEHDELIGSVEGVYMVGPSQADKARDIGIIGMLSSMIDYDASPSALE